MHQTTRSGVHGYKHHMTPAVPSLACQFPTHPYFLTLSLLSCILPLCPSPLSVSRTPGIFSEMPLPTLAMREDEGGPGVLCAE